MAVKTATATIDLKALVHNFDTIKALAPESKVLAVLKANAYGHGLARIAKALCHADAFGVARIDEALELRAAGVVKPIVLLEGFFSPEDLPVLAINNLQTIVHNKEQLHAIVKANLETPLKVWLKLDTGMHRLGVNPEEFTDFYNALINCKNVQQPLVLISHLGCADDISHHATKAQLAMFEQMTRNLPEEKSMANSAGILAWPQSHYHWVRPGLMLYGVSPLPINDNRCAFNGQPVMTLQSSLISVRKISQGELVGYGGAWTSSQATTIGVVAIGYGDGYPRHAVNGTPVLINGRRVPLVGRVSMDMITVDLGVDAQDSVGDIVTLWGQKLPVEEIAEYATTIPYELLCNITRRVQMKII